MDTSQTTATKAEKGTRYHADHYFIRVKGKDDKRSRLLTPNGGETTRRLHASMIPGTHIANVLANLREHNPDITFRAVPCHRRKRGEAK